MSSSTTTKQSPKKQTEDDTVECKYSPDNFVSPCCNAFKYYNANNEICSKCGNIISTIGKDDKITINVKFNMTNDSNNVSGDIIQNTLEEAKKYAHDDTCGILSKQCPRCKCQKCRYIRNPDNNVIYICTECRESFM